jgi:hypothetical protein
MCQRTISSTKMLCGASKSEGWHSDAHAPVHACMHACTKPQQAVLDRVHACTKPQQAMLGRVYALHACPQVQARQEAHALLLHANTLHLQLFPPPPPPLPCLMPQHQRHAAAAAAPTGKQTMHIGSQRR